MEQRKYFVDKNYVLGVVSARQMTVKELARQMGCNRSFIYLALNRGYKAPRSVFISRLVNLLELDQALVWRDE